MSNPSASRSRKRRTDKLDWEELEKAPNVEGMLSYLRQPPGNGVPSRQPAISGVTAVADISDEPTERVGVGEEPPGQPVNTPDLSAEVPTLATLVADPPVAGIAVNEGPEGKTEQQKTATGELNAAQPVSSSVVPEKATESSVPQVEPEQPRRASDLLRSPIGLRSAVGSRLSEPVPIAADEDLLGLPLGDLEINSALTNRRVHRCVYVQDAHTPGEQVVLSTLSRLAKHPRFGRAEAGGSYLVNVSLPELAVHAAMHPTNVRINLRSLIEKLAIELVEHEDRKRQTARTYRVLTFKQILERRRAAGLEYVIKNRGIRFVRKEEVDKLLATESLGSTFRARSWSLPSDTLSEVGSESLGALPSESLPVLIRSGVLKKQEETSTTSLASDLPAEIMKGLLRVVPFMDEQAVWMLWTECRARVSDCTVNEILGFVQAKATIALNGKIQNPVGFLLTAVPKCFEGSAFTTYREEENRRREEECRRQQREQERQKQLEEQGREEAEAYERGKRKLEALSRDQYQQLYDKTKQAFLARYPNALRSAPKTIDDLVQQQMIRDLQG
jgi:hypothetical protein